MERALSSLRRFGLRQISGILSTTTDLFPGYCFWKCICDSFCLLPAQPGLPRHPLHIFFASLSLDLLYETMNPEPAAITRMGLCVREAIDKLNRLPEEIVKAIDWPISSSPSGISEFISFADHYQSQVLAHASGAEALSYDYFHVFQKDLPYMQRRFLFGTPSQSYLSPCWF